MRPFRPAAGVPRLLQIACQRFAWETIGPLRGGQHAVWRIRSNRRHCVAKLRLPQFGRRLEKEANWLRQSAELGIKVPDLVEHLPDEQVHALLTSYVPAGPKQVMPPAAMIKALEPLHQLTPQNSGWGPLRADGLPRWTDENDAVAWYRQLIRRLGLGEAFEEELAATWPHRVPGLIHGDVHRGNVRGSTMLDWEQVCQVDIWEESTRLALARPWPKPWTWCQADPESRRWQGACLRSCLESAAFPGPRQRRARMLLGLRS